MRRHETELLAHQVIDRVEAGQPVEDDAFIELKADWPDDHAKAARRIAAHANAARGAEIVWLIGVNEKARSIPGASAVDPAQWFDQLRSYFEDSWAPKEHIVAVPRSGVTVIAIVFDTSGAPFLVKSGYRLEVPWRKGTRVSSAGRRELLQILVPIASAIDIKLNRGTLRKTEHPRDDDVEMPFELTLDVYLIPHGERTVVLPFHNMKCALFAEDGTEVFQFQECSAESHVTDITDSEASSAGRSPFLEATRNELILNGPGRASLKARGWSSWVDTEEIATSCEVRFQVRTAIDDQATTVRKHFECMSDSGSETTWRATWPAKLFPQPSGL